jgi:PAS domain S-box-containing protein
VVAILDLTQIGQSLGKVSVDYPRPAAIYLSDGTLLAATPHRDEAVGRIAPEFTTLRLPPRGAAFGVVADISSDQTRQMLTVAPIGDFPVLLGVTDDEAYSLASWRGVALPITAGTLLLVAFTGVVAAVLVQKLRRKEALAAALSLANDRYQHTVDTVMDAIIAVDESMTILLFNPAAQEMFGVKASDMIGQPLERLIPQRLRDVHRKHMADFGVTGMHSRSMAAQSQITGLRSDGQEFPIEATISQSRIEGKIQMTAVLRDVTLHRKAEGELRAANRQLRILSASLQDVREQERTRIARELHDELGQQLTGLKLSLSWLGIRLKEGRSANPDSVDDMRRLLDQAITSVRRISTDLRPPILDDLGFAEAVTWQSQEFARRSGIRISLSLDAHNHVQDPEMATALFRIVQESLTNAVRHSGAQNVNVELTEDDGALVLTIQDDGGGIRAHGTPAGIGLISMRERATSIGGQFEIISGPELGTTIQVRIALIEVAQEGMYA